MTCSELNKLNPVAEIIELRRGVNAGEVETIDAAVDAAVDETRTASWRLPIGWELKLVKAHAKW